MHGSLTKAMASLAKETEGIETTAGLRNIILLLGSVTAVDVELAWLY